MDTLNDLQMTELQAAIEVLLERIGKVCDEAGNTGRISPRNVQGLRQALIIPLVVMETTDAEYREGYTKATAARDVARMLAAIGHLMGAGR